jgi:Fe-S cluster biogenesis protein NfuA
VELREKVERTLNKVRPGLQADGGDVKLLDVTDDGIVRVSLTGACAGCPMSTMTLKMGIERTIMEEVPEIKRVEAL